MIFEVIVLVLLFITILILTASTWGQQKRVFVNKELLATATTKKGSSFAVEAVEREVNTCTASQLQFGCFDKTPYCICPGPLR